LKEYEAATIIRDLLGLVKYMHDNMYCHRDLKLENILYDPKKSSRSIKVYDFTTATKFTNERPLTDTVGTPYCMSPEILSGGYG
jgi:calcium-dependent protein kinase